MTTEQLKGIYPKAKTSNIEKYLPYLNKFMAKYGIVSFEQKTAFLAQIGHESGQLSAVVENLNYSASGLRSVFKKYYPTEELAAQFARQPERIANKVYANRIGNGNEQSGDGWKFRGRGLIQITGRYNYEQVTKGLGIDFINNPDLLTTPEYATEAACWWWNNAGLNKL